VVGSGVGEGRGRGVVVAGLGLTFGPVEAPLHAAAVTSASPKRIEKMASRAEGECRRCLMGRWGGHGLCHARRIRARISRALTNAYPRLNFHARHSIHEH
jgi:hypothetical protein